MIRAFSTPPIAGDGTLAEPRGLRHVGPRGKDQRDGVIDLDRVARAAYDRIVAPLEPLDRSVVISADGVLAALPFHALVHQGRWLVEDRKIVYCHSPLPGESLYMRQLSPSTRHLPPSSKVALLLGDPSYEAGNLLSLPGTKIEIRRVAKLLKTTRSKDGKNVFDEVRVFPGPEATVSKLIEATRRYDGSPRVVHIAAHGAFQEKPSRGFGEVRTGIW